jgi:perosamine synthetase
LQKLPGWIERRNQIADRYDRYLGAVADLTLLKRNCGHRHGFHLYVVRVAGGRRNQVFQTLRANGVGVNVHYVPVHLHPFYQERFGTHAGICPEAEAAFDEILSLPVYPGLTTEQQDTVIQQLTQALAGRHSRAA